MKTIRQDLVDVGQTAGSNVLIILVSFAAAVLAARLLGPEQRGTMAAAVVYVAIATAIADAGLNQAVPYFAARHKADAPAVLGTTCLLGFAFGGLTVIAASILIGLDGMAASAVRFYLPSVPFILVTTHLAGFMYGGGMLTAGNVVRTAQAAVLLLALLAAAATGRPHIADILVIAVLVNVLLLVGAAWVVSRRIPLRQWTPSAPVGRALLGYALQSYVGNLCWLFNSRLDQLMMSVLVPAAMLGIYSTSVSYAGVVFSVFSAFALLAFSRAGRESHDDVEIRRVIRRYFVMSLITGGPVALVVAVAAPWLYPRLFGVDFAPGVPAAMILCAASVLLGLNYTLSNGLRLRNRPMLPSIAEAAGVVVSAIGLSMVLPGAGMEGAALVACTSYATVFVCLLYFSRDREDPARSARSRW